MIPPPPPGVCKQWPGWNQFIWVPLAKALMLTDPTDGVNRTRPLLTHPPLRTVLSSPCAYCGLGGRITFAATLREVGQNLGAHLRACHFLGTLACDCSIRRERHAQWHPAPFLRYIVCALRKVALTVEDGLIGPVCTQPSTFPIPPLPGMPSPSISRALSAGGSGCRWVSVDSTGPALSLLSSCIRFSQGCHGIAWKTSKPVLFRREYLSPIGPHSLSAPFLYAVGGPLSSQDMHNSQLPTGPERSRSRAIYCLVMKATLHGWAFDNKCNKFNSVLWGCGPTRSLRGHLVC